MIYGQRKNGQPIYNQQIRDNCSLFHASTSILYLCEAILVILNNVAWILCERTANLVKEGYKYSLLFQDYVVRKGSRLQGLGGWIKNT